MNIEESIADNYAETLAEMREKSDDFCDVCGCGLTTELVRWPWGGGYEGKTCKNTNCEGGE